MSAGFELGFLGQRAGFQIAESWLEVSPEQSYAWLIAAGLLNTLTVLLLAGLLATAGGLALGLLRLARLPLLQLVLRTVIEPLRNTPVLLQLFVWYALLLKLPQLREAWHPLPGVWLSNRGLVLPALRLDGGPLLELARWQGLGLSGGWQLSPELAALVWGLAVFHAVYLSDIVRGAVLSVPLGPVQAARALGLRPLGVARVVLLPLALRGALPACANQLLALLKNSTLALAIGFQDLMAILNTTITQTGRALEGMSLAGAFYLGLSALLTWAVARHNARATRYGLLAGGGPRLSQLDTPQPLTRAALWGTPARALAHGLLLLALAALLTWGLRWALWQAVWSGPPEACEAGPPGAVGACWAVLAANYPLLLFGPLAPALRGQAALACLALLALFLLWLWPGLGLRGRAGGSTVALLLLAATLGGWAPGRTALPTLEWGGALVTLFLAGAVLALAPPLAGLLTWARRAGPPPLRLVAGALVNGSRALPLVVQLLLVSFWAPLLLGPGAAAGKFWWALGILWLHTGAQLAEVLRGALQALPPSQLEAARALGMRPHTAFFTVLWPQARRLAAPAALGVAVGAVKDSSLVMVIGLFDGLHAAKAVLADTGWRPYDLEVYGAVAGFYLLLCLPLSALSRRLARERAAH